MTTGPGIRVVIFWNLLVLLPRDHQLLASMPSKATVALPGDGDTLRSLRYGSTKGRKKNWREEPGAHEKHEFPWFSRSLMGKDHPSIQNPDNVTQGHLPAHTCLLPHSWLSETGLILPFAWSPHWEPPLILHR